MANPKADLVQLEQLWNAVRQEKPREMESRLRTEEADAAHRRHIEKIFVWVVVVLVGVVSIVCIGVVVVPGAPPENARWATTLLTAIVAAGLGRLSGKIEK